MFAVTLAPLLPTVTLATLLAPLAAVAGGAGVASDAVRLAPTLGTTSLASLPGSRGLVIVLRPPEVDELLQTALARVTGELYAANFQTSFVTLDPQADPTAQVEAVEPASGAVAAFAIAYAGDPSEHTIGIWVADRVGRRTTILRMSLQGDDVSRDAAVLALKAIELVRVSLAGLWPATPAHTEPPPTTEAPPPEASPEVGTRGTDKAAGPRVALGLGVSAQRDPGLPATQWMGNGTVMVTWPNGFGARLLFAGFGPALTLTETGGTAALRRNQAELAVTFTFVRREHFLSFVAAGGGAAHVTGEGTPSDSTPGVGQQRGAWAGIATVGAAAVVPVTHWLWMGVELDAIVTWPSLVVRIGDADTPAFTSPGVLGNAGLHVVF